MYYILFNCLNHVLIVQLCIYISNRMSKYMIVFFESFDNTYQLLRFSIFEDVGLRIWVSGLVDRQSTGSPPPKFVGLKCKELV